MITKYRNTRADIILRENIRSLLHARRVDAQDLAQWCGHQPAWLSKILDGSRGVQMDDVGKVADFFGLTVAELLSHGISPFLERRHAPRRGGTDRRTLADRRRPQEGGRLHPDVQPHFRDGPSGRRSSG